MIPYSKAEKAWLSGIILSSSCDCDFLEAQQQDEETNYELGITNYDFTNP